LKDWLGTYTLAYFVPRISDKEKETLMPSVASCFGLPMKKYARVFVPWQFFQACNVRVRLAPNINKGLKMTAEDKHDSLFCHGQAT
jgi:hypothetical protein